MKAYIIALAYKLTNTYLQIKDMNFDECIFHFFVYCLSFCNKIAFYSQHPWVKWPKNEDKVFLAILLPDAKNPKVNLELDRVFTFFGTARVENHLYELKLNLYDKVNVQVRAFCTHTSSSLQV